MPPPSRPVDSAYPPHHPQTPHHTHLAGGGQLHAGDDADRARAAGPPGRATVLGRAWQAQADAVADVADLGGAVLVRGPAEGHVEGQRAPAPARGVVAKGAAGGAEQAAARGHRRAQPKRVPLPLLHLAVVPAAVGSGRRRWSAQTASDQQRYRCGKTAAQPGAAVAASKRWSRTRCRRSGRAWGSWARARAAAGHTGPPACRSRRHQRGGTCPRPKRRRQPSG